MSIETDVAAHYGRPGLEQAILDALAAAGRPVDPIDPADLAGVDEFHLGWHDATVAFADDLAFPAGARILDIGSGIGGPARFLARTRGVSVTGIDLTEAFVETAEALSRRCGLADRVTFRQASATAMPLPDDSFDGATMIHVGMNIADKARVFAEARRVLRNGARFGVYEAMRGAPGTLPYPLPWAVTAETSFVETPDTYGQLLRDAGFVIEAEHDRTALVRDAARAMREQAARDGPPPVSIRILLGTLTQAQIMNVMQAIEDGTIVPTEIIARAA
jgi:SAM-dependent methyltransferase